MDCAQVQNRLSVYHDGELPRKYRTRVRDHVDRCQECGRILTGFRNLSALCSQLVDPEPPTGQWVKIEQVLYAVGAASPASFREPTTNWRRTGGTLAALAALVFIAVSVPLPVHRLSRFFDVTHDSAVAVNFGRYLDDYQQDPQNAQQALLARYGGRAVDLTEATREVGYEPMGATRLPPGYSVDGIYVLNMPCCVCTQVLCRRADGGLVTIFEHDKDRAAWFGDRPAIDVCCRGTPTRMVQVNELLAVTWKSRNRHLTVVGARDIEEVTQLIGHLEGTEGRT